MPAANRWSRILCVAALGLVATSASAHALRVMTFNVRYPSPTGPNSWPARRDLMVRTIREQHPDVFGTQELHTEQGDYLASHLRHYAWFGMGRLGDNKERDGNEHMGVFYRTDRLEVLRKGNFWLSDTPDVAGSDSWGQPYPRMVTWALFRVKATGRTFYLYDTHFPYRKQDAAIRRRCAKEILSRIGKLPHDVPFVMTGDFNSTPDSATYRLLTQHLHDAWASTTHHAGPELTFHDFTGKPDQRIDWILYRGFRTEDVRTVTTHAGSQYPSDHFPVVADLKWPSS